MSFQLALNECKLSASWTAAGRLFHTSWHNWAGNGEGFVAKFRSCPWNSKISARHRNCFK